MKGWAWSKAGCSLVLLPAQQVLAFRRRLAEPAAPQPRAASPGERQAQRQAEAAADAEQQPAVLRLRLRPRQLTG